MTQLSKYLIEHQKDILRRKKVIDIGKGVVFTWWTTENYVKSQQIICFMKFAHSHPSYSLISDEFVICKLKKFRRARLIRIINHYNYHFALWRRFRITDFHCFCIILLLIYEIDVFINKQFCMFFCFIFLFVNYLNFLNKQSLLSNFSSMTLFLSPWRSLVLKTLNNILSLPFLNKKKIFRLLETVVWKDHLFQKI